MYRVPDVTAVQAAAEHFGVTLTEADAEVYQKHLESQLGEFDEFVQARLDTTPPPRFPGAREPGYRPNAEEDPYNAWMWRCEIPGEAGSETDGELLAGKRVSFKDHIAVAGIPATFGAFALEGFVPDYDATVTSRSLAAGGTVVGKNVMNGLAGGFGFGGGTGDFGRPLNPHNPDHLTGGSSSGSAVALVRGETDVSFGGDQGGSIRIPASWSGCIGLKPTFGLVSHFGIGFGSDQSIDYTGPMTMTIEDAARALDATAGYDGLDPRQTKAVPDAYDSLSGLDQPITSLRIGVLEEGFAGATAEVTDSVNAAIEVLASLGAVVSKVSVPQHLTIGVAQQALSAEGGLGVRETGFFGLFAKTYYPADTIAAIMKLHQHQVEQLDPRSFSTFLAGYFAKKNYNGRLYAKAQNSRGGYVKAYDTALADVDVLVMPTTITQAPKFQPITDRAEALEYAMSGSSLLNAVNNTRPFNFTGHPALAVPTEKRNGLPVSIQFVGRMFADDLLLRVGQAYTKAVPFDQYTAVDG
ncbi:amidase family protein [Microlunatus endophyticus]